MIPSAPGNVSPFQSMTASPLTGQGDSRPANPPLEAESQSCWADAAVKPPGSQLRDGRLAVPALLVATGQTGHQRAAGTQLAPGSANSGVPWQCHPHPTHHSAIGLHAAESGQGVLGIDCHHHLAAGLVPVLPAQHRLLVLPGRGTHHSTAGAQAPPKQRGCLSQRMLPCKPPLGWLVQVGTSSTRTNSAFCAGL